MKKNNVARVIMTCFAVFLFACMAMGSSLFDPKDGPSEDDEGFGDTRDLINAEIWSLTGTCYTREEVAWIIYGFESIQMRWSDTKIEISGGGSIMVPELELVTPGEHEYDDDTRYEIKSLDANEDGIAMGVEVRVMNNTSACGIEGAEPQPASEIN